VARVQRAQYIPRTGQGVYLTLTWSDLYGKFDLARLMSVVEGAPYDWLLASLSVLGTVLANAGMPQGSQRGVIAELLDGEERRRALGYFDRRERQIVAHPEAIALGFKLAALRSPASDSIGDPSSLVRFLSGLNELTALKQRGSVPVRLHIHAAQQALWAEDLVREFDLFHRYEAALPDDIRFDFRNRFRTLTGLEALDFSAYAFGVYAMFARLESAQDLRDVNYRSLAESTGLRATNPTEFQRFLALTSRSRDELREQFSGADEERLSLSDSLTFRTAPLVRLEHGGVVPVWLEWIEEKIGSAPRYLIQNSINTDDEMQRFRGALGEAFEDYFLELLARTFPTGGQAILDARDGMPGCDAIILIDDAAVFLEFTVSEPSLEMLWNGDEAGVREFAANRLVGRGKLDQLGKTIKAYEAGELTIAPGRPLARRIYPIIVSLTPLPLLLGLDGVLRASIRKGNPEMASGRGNVRKVLFTCAKDWEILEPLLATGRVALADTFEGWIHLGLRSGLGDYLLRDRGFAGTRNPHLAERWDALAEVLAPRAIQLYGVEAAE
jgi:hypothetical protein